MVLFSKLSTFLRPIALILLMFLLSACEQWGRPSIATICETHPHLCEGLNEDGWCRAEKAEIIRNRFDHLNVRTDTHVYDLLLQYEAYEKCIEKASQIKHIKYREKETDRVEGYLTALNAIKKLSRDTRDSNDPRLQYYHWSRYGDDASRKRFLAQAKKGDFNTAELWEMVASVYLKRDNEAAKKALYKTLSYFEDTEDVPASIFESLITVNLDDERYASAFVWANVYADVNEMGEQALLRTKPLLKAPVNQTPLIELADTIGSAINQGNFNADRAGLWRLN